MIFHKHKLIFTGIPKNASTTMHELLRNPTDSHHTHNTIIEDYAHNDIDLMESYTSFAVIRNPYDRFISAIRHICRDDYGGNNLDLNELVDRHLRNDQYPQILLVPQHRFICFGNRVLIDHILKYENLSEEWENFSTEYNKTATFKIKTKLIHVGKGDNRKSWQEEIKELTQDNLDFINKRYDKDFLLFNYKPLQKI